MKAPTALFAAWLLPLSAAVSAAPVRDSTPPPRRQLDAATQAEDKASVVEICRRLLLDGGVSGKEKSELLTRMFRAQLDLDDPARAGETLARLEKDAAAPPPVELFALRGDLLAAEEKPLEAIAAWRQAARADAAQAAPVLEKIANQQESLRDWPGAVTAWREFLARQPLSAEAQARLAVALLNTGRAEEAWTAIQAANRLDAGDDLVKKTLPRFERLRAQLPRLHQLNARINAAAGATGARADALNPVAPGSGALPALLLDRALIFHQAGAVDPALADASRALELAKDSRAALVLKGQCLWQLGREDDAAKLRVARINDSKWFADRGGFERLRAADTFPLPSAPPTAVAAAHARRAAELLSIDQPVLALPDAEAAVKLNPRSADAAVILAAALLRNDRADEALAAAKHATELDARSADAWAMLARLEQERAELAAAADDFSRALALREEIRWLQRRENCLRALGRTADAERDHRRLQKLQPSAS